MEHFESLVISLLDSDANKGLFIGELCQALDIPKNCIKDIWLSTSVNKGVISQEVYVEIVGVKIKKSDLMKLPFKCIYENFIIFEVGDTII